VGARSRGAVPTADPGADRAGAAERPPGARAGVADPAAGSVHSGRRSRSLLLFRATRRHGAGDHEP